jgi:Cyclic nucleotide-binding domain
MSIAKFDPSAIIDRVLAFSTQSLTIERILLEFGLTPADITYDSIVEFALSNLTFSNVLALAGGIFLVSTFVVRTIVLMRVLCIFSIIFFLGSAALAYSLPKFLLYLLALPINIVRLVQIRNVVKRAKIAARGTVSIDWIRPYMAPRPYKKGDVLFRKGDVSTEMFLTDSGKFLVTEIGIEIPPGRMLGELGFISPTNQRTQSVECIEDGEVLTITYQKLTEIYFENSEFGYYFLRLVSDRLLQNLARLEGIVEQDNAKLEVLNPTKPVSYAMSKPILALRGLAANRSMKEDPLAIQQDQADWPLGKRMFTSLKKFPHALSGAKPANESKPLPVSPGLVANRPMTKNQLKLQKRRHKPSFRKRIFAKPRRFLRKILGSVLYWIGWVFAVLALGLAITLIVITGNPLVPLTIGAGGVIVWLAAIGLKYILARR